VRYFLERGRSLIIATTNKHHPAFKNKSDNLKVLFYKRKIDFHDFLARLKSEFKINRLTIQTGGTLNTVLLREGLIDYVSIVVAPALIGGRNTASLLDGDSLHTALELKHIRALKFTRCKVLKNSYLHLEYKVIN